MSKLSGLGGRLYRGETSIEIIGHRRRWYAVSALFILLSLGALSLQGLHLGIEFKGGSSFTVTKVGGSVEDARSAVAATGVPGESIIQTIGSDKVRVQTGALDTAQNNAVQDALAAKFSVPVESIDTQIVGPSWGKEITRKAVWSLWFLSLRDALPRNGFRAKDGSSGYRCGSTRCIHHRWYLRTRWI